MIKQLCNKVACIAEELFPPAIERVFLHSVEYLTEEFEELASVSEYSED